MRKNNQKGFTIIELLVVIVIIGILVALALPNLFAAQARGRDTERKNELSNAQKALETYFGDNGSYPATLDLVVTNATDREGPRQDAYTYTVRAVNGVDNQAYTLTATLENKADPKADHTTGAYTINSVNQ